MTQYEKELYVFTICAKYDFDDIDNIEYILNDLLHTVIEDKAILVSDFLYMAYIGNYITSHVFKQAFYKYYLILDRDSGVRD